MTIEPELELRPEVRAFAQLMERRLRANDHKPGWKGEAAYPLWDRLRQESDELFVAAVGEKTYFREAGSEELLQRPSTAEERGNEAADVANFALMIADNAGALPISPKDPWLPIDDAARKDLVWLLVDYSGEDADHPICDATYAATIGFWSANDDEWKLAGWCWTHDHFTSGHGKVLAYKRIGFPLEPPACFVPRADGANPPAGAIDAALRSKAGLQ